jgi:hypothetical protein
MILKGVNWNIWRNILYRLGGRGTNEYVAIVERYWKGNLNIGRKML